MGRDSLHLAGCISRLTEGALLDAGALVVGLVDCDAEGAEVAPPLLPDPLDPEFNADELRVLHSNPLAPLEVRNLAAAGRGRRPSGPPSLVAATFLAALDGVVEQLSANSGGYKKNYCI